MFPSHDLETMIRGLTQASLLWKQAVVIQKEAYYTCHMHTWQCVPNMQHLCLPFIHTHILPSQLIQGSLLWRLPFTALLPILRRPVPLATVLRPTSSLDPLFVLLLLALCSPFGCALLSMLLSLLACSLQVLVQANQSRQDNPSCNNRNKACHLPIAVMGQKLHVVRLWRTGWRDLPSALSLLEIVHV